MKETINVLVIADATPMRADIVDTIEQEDNLRLVGTAASSSQALTAVRDTEPEVILIDEYLNGANTLALTEDLVHRYPDLTVIAMAAEGHMNYLRQAMLAGARGFVTLPLANGELPQALRQFHRLDRTRQTKLVSETTEVVQTKEGTVIAIFSPKGGVGKTTLTANLGVAMALVTGERVALVDTNPQFGHLGLVLNVHANYSLMDLLVRSDDMEPELIEGMMAKHASGVRVLLAPAEIERADAIPPQGMSRLLTQLRGMYNWILVDTWPLLTDSSLDVLETADRVLLSVVPDITCMRDTKQFLDLVESLNYSLSKFGIIFNRSTEGGLDRKVIEEGLKRKVMIEVPQDEPAVSHSLNRGIPMVIGNKRSPFTKAIMQLARLIAAEGQESAAEDSLGSKFKSLFSTS
jgi:pilus assembly protein CpaE